MADFQFETIDIDINAEGVCTLSLNRPEVHNAFNETMIDDLSQALEQLENDDSVRVLCLQGHGKSFCAGADLNWMKRTADYTAEENHNDALRMAKMMHQLYSFPKPTLAIVHGAIFGGGVGLVACCDIVIADQSATFSLSEVKLGLIPAVIGPYVVNAMGPRIGKRYILSGERFDAAAAHHAGLVHECVDADAVGGVVTRLLSELLACGPYAQQVAKDHVIKNLSPPMDGNIQHHSANLIANIRASQEGREGVNAFLTKRSPDWRKS